MPRSTAERLAKHFAEHPHEDPLVVDLPGDEGFVEAVAVELKNLGHRVERDYTKNGRLIIRRTSA